MDTTSNTHNNGSGPDKPPHVQGNNNGQNPSINMAFLIVGALVHQGIIPVELDVRSESWDALMFATRIVAAILEEWPFPDTADGKIEYRADGSIIYNFPSLPFDY